MQIILRTWQEPPGAPLTYFNWGGGGATEVHILCSKKCQLQNLSTQKNPYFFRIPEESLSIFLHQQILFIFRKAKTRQLQLWVWSKTKLYKKKYKKLA